MVLGSRKRRSLSEDSTGNVSKKTKTSGNSKEGSHKAISGGGFKDGEGNEHWEIADKRRITISDFRGKRMISIREYYQKDGQMLPGKKGISLPLSQFSSIISLLPHIDAVLKEKGEALPRPDYGGLLPANNEDEEEQTDEKEKKRNFEETSDEDG